MSSEEKQLLFGEYAAGRISAVDQRRLMAAALEDDELFKAIAEQEELSELIAVIPAPPARRRIWPMVMTAAATGALTLGLFLMLRPKPEPVMEMAKAVPPPQEMVSPPPVTPPVPAPVRKRAPLAMSAPKVAAEPEREAKKAEFAEAEMMMVPSSYQILHRDPEGSAQMVDGESLLIRYRVPQAGRFALVEMGSGRELASATAGAGATLDLPFTAVRGAMNLEIRRSEVAVATGRMADRAESRAAAPAPAAPVRISLTIR